MEEWKRKVDGDPRALTELLVETVWRRGWRDTIRRVGSVQFWVAELLMGIVVPIAASGLPTGVTIVATATGALSLAVAVYVAALFTAPSRQRDDIRAVARQLVPAFTVDCDATKPFVHETTLDPINIGAIYVRVLPSPQCVRVSRCTGWLTEIEILESANQFVPTEFHRTDSLQLKWSMRGDLALEPLDLINGVQRFLDVLHVHEHCDRLLLDVPAIPNWLADTAKLPGTYRFTVKVVSDDGVADTIRLIVKWTGKWNELEVRSDDARGEG